MAENRNTVVYTVNGDERAVRWLRVSMESVRRHMGDGVRIVVCTDRPMDFGLGSECVDARPYVERFGIGRMCAGRTFNGRSVPDMQVFRLALPIVEELASEERVLFLDCDTEVVDTRAADVFGLDSSCFDCLGAKDCPWSKETMNANVSGIRYSGALDRIPRENMDRMLGGTYVNAGVLLMNLGRLRSAHGEYSSFLSRQIELCAKFSLPQMDQSVINAMWDVGTMDTRFNAWGKTADGTEWIRHYPGMEKFQSETYPPVGSILRREDGLPDIVYTVGLPSEHEDSELRWSLRSIEKYGRNYGRVIVTSPVPRDWLSDEVIQVDSQDLPSAGYKHHNILKSILDTVDVLGLDGTFFVSSDDHFYVKPVDFSCQPLYAQHWTIPHNMGSSDNLHTMLWKTSCSDTMEFLIKNGLPTIDFQMHRNSKWHGAIVNANRDLFIKALTLRFCVEPHVLMQNLWVHAQPDTRVEFRHDYKIRSFYGISERCDCISCYDQTFLDPGFMEFMDREFGEKCRFEKA